MIRPDWRRMLPRNRRCWWILLILLMIPVSAGPTEFSAQMVVKDSGKTMPGKFFFQNGKMRQEFQDEEGQTITIVRPDKKAVWVVLPQDRTYLEIALKMRLPGQFIQMPPDAIQKRPLGTETVNGYEADKYEVTVRGGADGVEKQTFWIAKKLGVPIKVFCHSRDFCIEYRNIKEGRVNDSLFEPPSGFKKATHLTGFTGKVREQVK
jgi:outer membrane lipoprotein-sorting protein